jgi:hypothetical protein
MKKEKQIDRALRDRRNTVYKEADEETCSVK